MIDKTVKELIENEKVASNQLKLANSPETIQNAIEVLEKARQTLEAYRIYRKKEYEYKLAIEQRDTYLKKL